LNRIEQDLGAFIEALEKLSSEELCDVAEDAEPERKIAALFPVAPRPAEERSAHAGSFGMQLRLKAGAILRAVGARDSRGD